MVAERARETGAAFALCNLVGGQDELVFDGHSVDRLGTTGATLARGAQFAEELVVCDLERAAEHRAPEPRVGRRADPAGAPRCAPVRASRADDPALAEPLEPDAEVYEALVLGLARLRAQERLRAGAGRGLGRNRLGARRR